jgi:hypothetical protein
LCRGLTRHGYAGPGWVATAGRSVASRDKASCVVTLKTRRHTDYDRASLWTFNGTLPTARVKRCGKMVTSGAGLVLRTIGLDSRPVHAGYIETGAARSTSVSPLSNIPPMLHSHLHLHVALTSRTERHNLGTLLFCNVCVCVGFVMCGCFGNMYTVL